MWKPERLCAAAAKQTNGTNWTDGQTDQKLTKKEIQIEEKEDKFCQKKKVVIEESTQKKCIFIFQNFSRNRNFSWFENNMS